MGTGRRKISPSPTSGTAFWSPHQWESQKCRKQTSSLHGLRGRSPSFPSLGLRPTCRCSFYLGIWDWSCQIKRRPSPKFWINNKERSRRSRWRAVFSFARCEQFYLGSTSTLNPRNILFWLPLVPQTTQSQCSWGSCSDLLHLYLRTGVSLL